MALFKRSGPAEAAYARVIDGEHLWLDVRGDGPVVLRGDGVADLEVTTDPFPLAAALADVDADALELRLLAKGRPVAAAFEQVRGPGLVAPPTRDRRWQLQVAAVDGEVVVRRTRLVPTVAATGFARADDAAEVRLATDATEAELVADGEVLTTLPITAGLLRIGQVPALPAGATATIRVAGADVARPGNALARPTSAVALPPLPEPDVSLRWTPEARLAVRREDAS